MKKILSLILTAIFGIGASAAINTKKKTVLEKLENENLIQKKDVDMSTSTTGGFL